MGLFAQAAIFPADPQLPPRYEGSLLDSEMDWTSNNVHDPSIFKEGDTYWVYSTDVEVGHSPHPGGQIRSSKDLIHWKWEGRIFPDVPAEAKSWSNAESLWAPDIVKIGSQFVLYYSASVLYSQNSAIGMAIGPSPKGPWKDLGVILKSSPETEPNAIDPAPFRDAEGKLWMTYGSFAGGIFLIKLDDNTGKPGEPFPGHLVARRSEGGPLGCEGPYISYNPDLKKYFLFLSYDSLFTDYNVRVGRSDKVEGPYLDQDGHEMTNVDADVPRTEVGYKLMGGYSFRYGEGWLAPGGNSVLHDGKDWFIVHHIRGVNDKNWPWLQVRRMVWSDNGWPLVSPEPYAGEKPGDLDPQWVAGNWDVLILERSSWEDPKAEAAKLEAGGKLSGALGTGKWVMKDGKTIEITFDWSRGVPVTIRGKLLPAWDQEYNRPTVVFAGIDDHGQQWWGKRTEKLEWYEKNGYNRGQR